jgi:hypothetical protein
MSMRLSIPNLPENTFVRLVNSGTDAVGVGRVSKHIVEAGQIELFLRQRFPGIPARKTGNYQLNQYRIPLCRTPWARARKGSVDTFRVSNMDHSGFPHSWTGGPIWCRCLMGQGPASQPAGGNGAYFQDVPMVGVKTPLETKFQFAPGNGEALTLKDLGEFVTNDESQTEMADIDALIVFVGYGIKAPEYNWDDYKGTDLQGIAALLFVNEPISDDPKFKGKALTYYGHWTYKFEETSRRGAVATLVIHRTDLASYGWEMLRNSWG